MIQLNVTEMLDRRQSEKDAQAEVEFHRLVIELDGASTSPDPDTLLSKLQRIQKTPQELHEALGRLRERRRLAGLMAEVPQHREDYAKYHAEIGEEVARFAPIITAHEARLHQLRALRSAAQSGERDGGSAERELRDNCNPKLRDSIADATTRLKNLDDAIQQNGWDIEKAETAIRDEPERWRKAYGRIDQDGVREQVEKLTEQLAKLRTEGERRASLRPGLVDELDRLRAESLTVEAF